MFTPTQRARILRKRSTPAEQILWQALRNRSLKAKFRRQFPIGKYVVDFACFRERLIVELDGLGHERYANALYDEARTRELESKGWRILRFKNDEIAGDISIALTEIDLALQGETLPISDTESS
jgi:very-short-patch-repair endonuclease